MKKMKTLSVLAFILLCGVLILAGCGNNNSINDKPESGEDVADSLTGNDHNPIVTIEMEDGGKVEVELYPDIAPNTVKNFISLAKSGFYDGVIFHRVIPDFMVQGGDPDGTGMGGPGYSIKGEFTNNGFTNNLAHQRGVISMARQANNMDSAGSQFFIMVADVDSLDGDYAAFGKVVLGMETVDSIVAVETDASDRPLQNQTIKKMTVDTKGVEYEEPEKIQ